MPTMSELALDIVVMEEFNYYNYFTEIEETFVRRRGKHLLLSPIDWIEVTLQFYSKACAQQLAEAQQHLIFKTLNVNLDRVRCRDQLPVKQLVISRALDLLRPGDGEDVADRVAVQ